jgi:hypothetical protein
MPSKQVTDRSKSALAVISAGRTHNSEVAAALKELLAPELQKGETLPDVELLIELAARSLHKTEKAMVAADDAHARELADDAAPREARDETATLLSDELIELREWVIGLYGPGALERFGFSGPTPADPVALQAFARGVIASLQDKSKPMPKSRRKGVKWDQAETIARLEALTSKMESHLQKVAKEVREGQATQQAKNDAITTYDERFSRVATFFVGLFRLAGHDALAEQVRPSTRRRGQIAAHQAPEGDVEPTEPAAG